MAEQRRVKSKSGCAVTRGEVDLDYYKARDVEWRALGLAAPARRALVDAGLLRPGDLATWSATDLAGLHGIGKTALTVLRPWLRSV
jgi:hypothetical protein